MSVANRRSKPSSSSLEDGQDGMPISDGSHALITSISAIGEATAEHPVVSTLVFCFAIEQLFDGASSQSGKSGETSWHVLTLVLLATSAALSLYTTTYSVLEFYYIKVDPCAARAAPTSICALSRRASNAPAHR